MKSKLLLAFLLAGTFAVNPVFSHTACAEGKQGKPGKKTDQKSTSRLQKTRGDGAAELLPVDLFLNDPPPHSPVLKTRGDICSLRVDNGTDLKVVVFVNNKADSVVPSNGGATSTLGGGPLNLKGVAYNTDGTSAVFGPLVVPYCNGTYTWSLAR